MSKGNWFNNNAEKHIDKKTDTACYMMLKAIYYRLGCIEEELKKGNGQKIKDFEGY